MNWKQYRLVSEETKQKHEIQNPEFWIIKTENEDRKTSLKQCSVNKHQFTIYPAEHLLLTLIEY